jgi:hypothetical protein
MKGTRIGVLCVLAAVSIIVAGFSLSSAMDDSTALKSEEDARERALSLDVTDFDRVVEDTMKVDGEMRDVWVFEKYYGDTMSIYMQDWVTVLVLDAETGESLDFVQPQ